MELAGILFSIGMILCLVGFILTFIGTIWSASKRPTGNKETRRVGGLVMIGPIPIIFGSDRKISKLLLMIAFSVVIIFFILLLISPLPG